MGRIGDKLVSLMRPVDWLVAGYQLAMAVVSVVFRNNIDLWAGVSLRHLLALAFMVTVRGLRLKYQKRWLQIISDWYLILSLPLAYTWAGTFVHAVFPWKLDAVLHMIDLRLLGSDPTAFLQSLARPWLTDLMQLSYCSFFLIIFSSYLILYLKGNRRQYQNMEMVTITALYGTYLYFMLLPAHSPRFITCPELELRGGWITQIINDFLNRAAYPGGAFPSGHSSASISICVFMWRYARRWAPWFTLATLLLLVSTVYGGYHYVIDLLAGLAHGGLASLIAVLWNRKWRRLGLLL
jgi:membrane-associated phospholipid phosphatase